MRKLEAALRLGRAPAKTGRSEPGRGRLSPLKFVSGADARQRRTSSRAKGAAIPNGPPMACQRVSIHATVSPGPTAAAGAAVVETWGPNRLAVVAPYGRCFRSRMETGGTQRNHLEAAKWVLSRADLGDAVPSAATPVRHAASNLYGAEWQ
jgi:hypothetical protein